MRTTLGILGVAIACAFVTADLPAQNRVVVEIPITVERNKTIVPVTAGGASLRLILDSGMDYDGILIFGTNKIDTTAFGHLMRAQIGGAGSGSASQALTDASAGFSVGRLAIKNQRVTILTGDTFKGFPTDGAVGYSLLGHYAVEIDYDKSLMTLYEPERFAPESGWKSLEIYFKTNRVPWADIMVATEDEPPVRISTYIDFASSETLELLTRADNKFRLPAKTTDRYLGRGLSGDIFGQEGTIARMWIGSHLFTDVLVALAPASVRSRQGTADGIIGSNALRRFNVIFDYAHNKVHIRPNSHFSERFQ